MQRQRSDLLSVAPRASSSPAGEEVTGIMAPVSICMAITVALVRVLNPDGSSSSSNSVVIASLAYDEKARQMPASAARKSLQVHLRPRTCWRESTVLCSSAGSRLVRTEIRRGPPQCPDLRRHHGSHDVHTCTAVQVRVLQDHLRVHGVRR